MHTQSEKPAETQLTSDYMTVNAQPIEKLSHQENGELDVHSIFYTIQGEGPNTGKPAIFLRLAGCNLQCPMCDTDYTTGRKKMSFYRIEADIEELKFTEQPDAPKPLVVITGGEPFRQNITRICKMLLANGFPVQVETNGTLPPPDGFPDAVQIVCSPKTGSIHKSLQGEGRIHALKYVVQAGQVMSDGLPSRALGNPCTPRLARPPEGFPLGMVYVQPADSGNPFENAKNLKATMQATMSHGHTLQLQVHKILKVE